VLRHHADVYWDGRLLKSYPTDDKRQGKSLLLNVGRSGSVLTGTASQVQVDWVRAWRPARRRPADLDRYRRARAVQRRV
jgi:hypothetical protein